MPQHHNSINILLFFIPCALLMNTLDQAFISDMERAKRLGREISLIFYGDSILQCLRFPQGACGDSLEVGEERFGKYNYFVAAVGNAMSSQILASVMDGVVPLDDDSQRNRTVVAAVMIGHNEIVGGADRTANGIESIVDVLLDSNPNMQVPTLASQQQ